MKLFFKQKIFSLLDSFEIYNEQQEVVYTVKGKFAFAHHLQIFVSVK